MNNNTYLVLIVLFFTFFMPSVHAAEKVDYVCIENPLSGFRVDSVTVNGTVVAPLKKPGTQFYRYKNAKEKNTIKIKGELLLVGRCRGPVELKETLESGYLLRLKWKKVWSCAIVPVKRKVRLSHCK